MLGLAQTTKRFKTVCADLATCVLGEGCARGVRGGSGGPRMSVARATDVPTSGARDCSLRRGGERSAFEGWEFETVGSVWAVVCLLPGMDVGVNVSCACSSGTCALDQNGCPVPGENLVGPV